MKWKSKENGTVIFGIFVVPINLGVLLVANQD